MIEYILLIPGPAFWGLINPEWSLCNKGRRQSPVNLEPSKLLYDPNLRPVHIDKIRVSRKKPSINHLNFKAKDFHSYSRVLHACYRVL
jgi:Carbonic anhydrase